jgi:hypothetical protein
VVVQEDALEGEAVLEGIGQAQGSLLPQAQLTRLPWVLVALAYLQRQRQVQTETTVQIQYFLLLLLPVVDMAVVVKTLEEVVVLGVVVDFPETLNQEVLVIPHP